MFAEWFSKFYTWKNSFLGKASIGTDLQVQIPRGYYGRIAPRSGLAIKKFIDVGAGVVDSDYRGHLSVILFNFGTEDFQVSLQE